MIEPVAACLVEVVDRDELDTDIVQTPVREPALIGIESPALPDPGNMGCLRLEVAPFFCSTVFHVSIFHELLLYQYSHTCTETRPVHKTSIVSPCDAIEATT